MQEHKLSAAAQVQVRSRTLKFGLPLLGLAALVGLTTSWSDRSSSPPFAVIVPTLLLVLAAGGVGIGLSLRQNQRFWASYRILVRDGSISRIQEGLPDLTIARYEITKVVEGAAGGLAVHASDPTRQLAVPKEMEGYAQLRATLAQWHDIEVWTPQVTGRRTAAHWVGLYAVAWLVLAGMALVFLPTGPVVGGGAAAVLIAVLLASAVYLRQSRDVPLHLKRHWWGVILVIVPLAARLLAALNGR